MDCCRHMVFCRTITAGRTPGILEARVAVLASVSCSRQLLPGVHGPRGVAIDTYARISLGLNPGLATPSFR